MRTTNDGATCLQAVCVARGRAGRFGILVLLALLAGCGEASPEDRASSADAPETELARRSEAGTAPGASDGPGAPVAAGLDTGAAYMCPPCSVHDSLHFHDDGECPVCGMTLIERPELSPVGQIDVHVGSGNFRLPGGPGHEEKVVTVFYHQPESFGPSSHVLVVLPGSGRDADEYRDAWIEASEEHGVLVLSPMYPEEDYDFGAYHMGGLMYDLNLDRSVEYVDGSNEVILDEEAFRYRVNTDRRQWIFDDFDRIFERVRAAVGSSGQTYDLFGHSAGGQILHRLALLRPGVRAHRIVAANSGFYTLPDLDADLPFGLANAPISGEDLALSFRQRLVLLLGEEDDAEETGGILLRSPSADRQGAHRLERGRHFYHTARRRAEDIGAEFRWELRVVSGVGHDFRRMSRAAAEYLYQDGEDRVNPGS